MVQLTVIGEGNQVEGLLSARRQELIVTLRTCWPAVWPGRTSREISPAGAPLGTRRRALPKPAGQKTSTEFGVKMAVVHSLSLADRGQALATAGNSRMNPDRRRTLP